MQKLSLIANVLQIGSSANAASNLQSCTITAGVAAAGAGNDIVASGQFVATRVWNAVWNDIVDFQQVCDDVIYGKCYFDTFDGARICNQRNQKSIIGLASDTFGFAVGRRPDIKQVPIAVAGWVLAFVDKTYESGTVLTSDVNGNLTEMTHEEKVNYPERIVAIYKRPELEKFFGIEGSKIEVNGRHWVKVK